MGSSRGTVVCGALALTILSVRAQAQTEPLVFAPASQWVLDYADDNCALRRAFQANEDKAILEIRQYAPGANFEVVLVSDTLERTRQGPRVRFEPDEGLFDPPDARLVNDAVRHGVQYFDSLRPIALRPENERWIPWSPEDRDAREQAVTGLTVTASFGRTVTLQTGKMHQPMEAMRACLGELMTHWGLDAAVQETLSRPATPIDQMSWARRAQQNYPADMLRAGKSGRVTVRLIVGPDGKPTACLPIGTIAEPSFEEAACASMMRYARLEPALDANKEPVATVFVTTMIYKTGS